MLWFHDFYQDEAARDLIKVSAITEPHQGTPYDPPADAHHKLLLKAAPIEQKLVTEAEKLAEVKTRRDSCRVIEDLDETGLAPGMTVQEITDQDEKEDVSPDFLLETRAVPSRKTKAQQNKEAWVLAEASIGTLSLIVRSDCKIFRNVLSRNEFWRKDY